MNNVCKAQVLTLHQKKYTPPSCSDTNREYACNLSLCVCEKAFGIHEFAKEITDNGGNLKVINHPVKFILLLEEKHSLMSGPVWYIQSDRS